MNIYDKTCLLEEIIPNKENSKRLDSLFENFKIAFLDNNESFDEAELTNDFCLVTLIIKLAEYKKGQRKYLRNKYLNKINKNCLLKKYLRVINICIRNNEEKNVELLFKSLIEMGYIKDASYEKQDSDHAITLIMPDNRVIKFRNIPLDNWIIDEYRGRCHEVIEYYIKNTEKDNWRGVVDLEYNELYGKHYHSFIVDDELVYDFAQDIVMLYKDYLDLFNPEILVNERTKDIIAGMNVLETNDKVYYDSDTLPLLKYGISKQIKK